MASDKEASKTNINSEKQDLNITTESWMSSLPVHLLQVPLSKLAIPGSHDSGTFFCDHELAPDAEKVVADLAKIPIPFLKDVVGEVIHRWAQCQNLNFTKQLESGIRYFDLRVSTKSGSEDFFLVHTVFGPKVSMLVTEVAEFLKAHPQEIVLLDFNHFYAMEAEHHVQLITYLLSEFGSKICHRCVVDELTLHNLWAQGKQVIIFYQHEEATSFEEIWQEDDIISLWANTDRPDDCIKYLNGCFSKPPMKNFTVCQGVLTPSVATIAESIISGNSIEKLSGTFQPLFCSWLEESPCHCSYPLNIVTADFTENNNLIRKVISLNYKRTVSQ